MILFDFSSLLHRAVFSASSGAQPTKKDGKFITEEYINLAFYRILDELIMADLQYSAKYGELIICLDDHSKRYWRCDVYKDYKNNRSKIRKESDINYPEVFEYINELLDMLRHASPWKVFEVPGAEADDTMAILAKKYNQTPVLILSPDKDMIQLQKYGNIEQYSALTKKWIKPEHKGSMEQWLHEHVVLGDVSDGVPKVVEHCDFSENFLKHLQDYIVTNMPTENINIDGDIMQVHNFNNYFDKPKNLEHKIEIFRTYDIWQTNKKGEETILDIYAKVRFGASTLNKAIDNAGSFDKWLDSHPLYRKHYERNAILVLEENVPQNIVVETLIQFNEAKTHYDFKVFDTFLEKYRLGQIQDEFRKISGKYTERVELSLDNCGW